MASHGRKVEALKQPMQLLCRQVQRRGLCGPDKPVRLQSFMEEPESGTIPQQQLDTVAPLVAEDVDGGGKRILAQCMFDQCRQAVDAKAAVHGIAVQQHRQAVVEAEHGRLCSVVSQVDNDSASRWRNSISTPLGKRA